MLSAHSKDHVNCVSRVLRNIACLPQVPVSTSILDSWRRSTEQHRLDPGSLQGSRTLSQALLDERRERSELFLRITSEEVARLRGRVCGTDCCVLFTGAQGRIIDYHVESAIRNDCRRVGLYLGTCRPEGEEGTCGVAAVLTDRTAVMVRKCDHFHAALIDLICFVVPVSDPQGELLGVLDASVVQSPDDRRSQYLIQQMVAQSAREIENAFFVHSAQGHWVLRAYRTPGYVDSQSDYLFAWDADGRLLALNPAARHHLRQCLGQMSSHIGEVSDLDTLHAAVDQVPCLLRGQADELHVCPNAPRAKARRLKRRASDDAALDPRIAESLRLAVRVKGRNLPVLIQGEAGTGKEAFARQLHQASARRDKPFVALNCAAIPESPVESELFSYVGGVFTGAAAKGIRGLLQQANGGTLFLDEIGDTLLGLQARLLRVLAEGEVAPLGAVCRQAVDVWAIYVTYRDLAALVTAGGLREDLYFRLGGAHFKLPPLRERSDRLALIRCTLDEETVRCGVRIEPGEVALECLFGYRWPDNVRQSRHVSRYACALYDGATLQLADPPVELRGEGRTPASACESGGGPECDALLDALVRHRWKPMVAARELDILRVTLYRRVRRYGIYVSGQADD